MTFSTLSFVAFSSSRTDSTGISCSCLGDGHIMMGALLRSSVNVPALLEYGVLDECGYFHTQGLDYKPPSLVFVARFCPTFGIRGLRRKVHSSKDTWYFLKEHTLRQL